MTLPYVVAALLAVCAAAGAQERRPEPKWNNVPASTAPGVEHRSYHSASMDTEVGYSVWLPPGYAEGKARYPVIYFLHGAGGNENSDAGGFSSIVAKLIEEKAVKPAICVFPNGGVSGYQDRHGQRQMGETTIVKELVPLIDRTFRTKRERAFRVISGFSMGGSGSVRLAMKHPDVFSAVAAWAGMFAPRNGELPAELSLENVKKLKGRVRLMLVVGEKDFALGAQGPFIDALKQADYAIERRVLPEVSHDLGKYYELTGADAVKFLAEKW